LYKFAKIILSIEDALGESLDILDSSYKSMYEILQKPIFFDSIEVRQCINEIKKSRESILYIANILTKPMNQNLSLSETNEATMDDLNAEEEG
jgi:hypothetical protein